MLKKSLLTMFVLSFVWLSISSNILAASGASKIVGISDLTPDTLTNYIEKIMTWVAGLIGAISVGFLLYAGFKFMASEGEEEEVTAAKKILLYSLIGIIVAIFAFSAVGFVGNLLGSGTTR